MFHEIRPLSASTLSSVQLAVMPVPSLLARRGARSLPFFVADTITASGSYFFTSAVSTFVYAAVLYSAKRASSTRIIASGAQAAAVFTASSVPWPITTAITCPPVLPVMVRAAVNSSRELPFTPAPDSSMTVKISLFVFFIRSPHIILALRSAESRLPAISSLLSPLTVTQDLLCSGK